MMRLEYFPTWLFKQDRIDIKIIVMLNLIQIIVGCNINDFCGKLIFQKIVKKPIYLKVVELVTRFLGEQKVVMVLYLNYREDWRGREIHQDLSEFSHMDPILLLTKQNLKAKHRRRKYWFEWCLWAGGIISVH